MLTRIIDPHEESLETPKEKYCAVKVILQNTSKVIEQLNEAFPLENSRHLKRIKKITDHEYVTALVCKISSEYEITEIESKLQENSIPFVDLEFVDVPTRRPITKKQYAAWNSMWPLVFHESMDEKLKMKQLLDHTNLFNQYHEYFIENNVSAMIFECCDNFKFSEKNIIYETFAERILCDEALNNYPFDHFVLNCLSGTPKNKRNIINGKIPYLLSGCVAILLHEPCTMCSMALLHSRIDAVIYIKQNDVAGALGSKCNLHSMDSLNHRYSVYIADIQPQIK